MNMVRQIVHDEALTARIERVGQELTNVSGDDLDFVANLLMAMALSSRREIDGMRNTVAAAVQGRRR